MFNGKTNIVTSAADGCGKPSSIRSMDNSHCSNMEQKKEPFMLSNRSSVSHGCSIAAAAIAVGAMAMFAVGNARANLILNGDFSVAASAYLSGWTPTYPAVYGGLGVQGPGNSGGAAPGSSDNVFPPASVTSGQQHFAYLQGGLVSQTSSTLSPASLGQSFTTAVGRSYVVSFYAAQRGADTSPYAQLQVQAIDSNNNVLVTASSNAGGGLSINANGWTANTFNFTADTTSTTLTFADAPNSVPSDTVDFTAVDVTAVPMPNSTALK